VFMEVLIPTTDNMNYVSDTGVPIQRDTREVFSFLNLNENNWIFIENRFYNSSGVWDVNLSSNNASNVGYVFGYHEKLSEGYETKPLFSGLKPPNFTEEGVWAWLFLPVTVRVYAIQSEWVNGATIDSSAAVMDITNLDKTDLGYILNTFTNQNSTVLINGWLKNANTSGKLKVDGSSIN